VRSALRLPGRRRTGVGPGRVGAPVTADAVVRVLVVDDHALFRRGIVLVLEGEDDIEVVGECVDGEAAVQEAAALAPDVVLMDVRMPGGGGIEATRRLAEVAPASRVLMMTVSDEEDDLYEAVKAGATGYLLKEISVEAVAEAVRGVVRGQTLITPSMASKLIAEFNHLSRQAEERQPPPPRLTERELEVLGLVARGLTNREVAEVLVISENTVKNHVRNILEKLHLHSRLQAVVYAVRQKILDLDEGTPHRD
jgi:DNA-binding NarL/FixJ family response regulator